MGQSLLTPLSKVEQGGGVATVDVGGREGLLGGRLKLDTRRILSKVQQYETDLEFGRNEADNAQQFMVQTGVGKGMIHTKHWAPASYDSEIKNAQLTIFLFVFDEIYEK